MTKTLKERIARARRIAAKALLLAALLAVATVAGQEVVQPPAQTDGGTPLMQALKERRTTRSFAAPPLSPQALSNLLWAGFGINRPDGHRTGPSARNAQEIDIYAVLRDRLYVYDAQAHAQNAYLYCASEGSAAAVFASIDRERFAQAAQLAPEQKITLAQSVGYPKP